MGNMKCETDIKQTFTETGYAADSTVSPGLAVKETTEYDGVTKTYTLYASATMAIKGVAAGVPTGGGTVPTYAAGGNMQIFKMGGNAIVLLSGSVTDITVPLKVDSGGAFTPCTSGTSAFNAIPLELGSSGEYIAVNLQYGVTVI
jgi:hypothetical protein